MRNSTVVKLLFAAVFGPALSAAMARAEAPSLNFDQGVDIKAALDQARQSAAKDTAKVSAARVSATRYETDCVRFTFAPDDAATSEAVWLRSTEWVEECHWGDPRHGGRQCWERPGYTYRERVQITLRDRKPLLPWESDTFRVCLQGPWLDIDDVATAYDYKVVNGGDRNGHFVLAPTKKTPMKPDPAGIAAQSLSSALALTLKDKWASYYAGEKVSFKLTLKKDVPNWFDPTLIEKEVVFAAADPYSVDLKAYAGEFSQKLEAGKKYYVKISFKRLGQVSKDSSVDIGETEHVEYRPAAPAFAMR